MLIQTHQNDCQENERVIMRLSPGNNAVSFFSTPAPEVPQVRRLPVSLQSGGGCDVDLFWNPYHPEWGEQISRVATYLASIGEALETAIAGDIKALSEIVFSFPTGGGLNIISTLARTYIQTAWPAMRKILQSAWNCARKVHIGGQGTHKFVMRGCVFYKTLITAMRSFASTENEASMISISFGVEFDNAIKIIDYIYNYYSRQEIGSIADIIQGYIKGYLSYSDMMHGMRCYGVPPKLIQSMIGSAQTLITEEEVSMLWWRFSRDPIKLWKTLQPYGYTDFDQIADRIEASKFMPPISDWIRFAIKDVFDPNKPGKAEMLQELSEQTNLLDIFAANGIGEIPYKTLTGQIRTANIPEFYWLSSFEDISPEQSFEMFRRLRPERIAKWALPGQSPQQTSNMVFTLQDMRKLLKERDVNPIYRDRLAAISYHVMTRVDVRRVYLVHGFGQTQLTRGFKTEPNGRKSPIGIAERELTAQYQDQGYAPEDAAALAYFTAFEIESSKEKAKISKLMSQVCQGLQIGIIDEEQAKVLLRHPLIPQDLRDAKIAECKADHRLKRARAAIAAIRKRYIRGELSEQVARVFLNSLGVQNGWINLELQVWNYERRSIGKEIMANQLSKWYDKGLINRDEFLFRLTNIGYAPLDAMRVIRYSELGTLARTQKERQRRIKEIARDKDKIQQERERRKRRIEDTVREIAKTRTKGLTVANLRKWFKLGIINCESVRNALTLDNWPKENIEAFIKELTTENKDKPCNGVLTTSNGESDDATKDEKEDE